MLPVFELHAWHTRSVFNLHRIFVAWQGTHNDFQYDNYLSLNYATLRSDRIPKKVDITWLKSQKDAWINYT